MDTVAAFACALVASAILSLGMVLQKRHIAFIGYKGKRGAAFRRDRSGWLAGFTLVNVAPLFNYLALLGLPANVVAGVAGSNVAFAGLFSAFLLGERLESRALGPTILLFAGIALAGLRSGGSPETANFAFIWVFMLVPLALAAVALVLRGRGKSQILAATIGGVAGCLGGFMIVLLKLLGTAEPTIAGWLASPWLWLYLIAGISSFSIVQLAYKDGEMNRVGPAYYGMQVLWPAGASLFVFSLPFDFLQWIAFGVIALSVGLIAASEKSRS